MPRDDGSGARGRLARLFVPRRWRWTLVRLAVAAALLVVFRYEVLTGLVWAHNAAWKVWTGSARNNSADVDRLMRLRGPGAWMVVRMGEASAFASASGRDAIPILLEVAASREDPQARAYALKGLAGCWDARTIPTCVALLSDASPVVRGTAADTLGELADEGVLPALRKAREAETDADARVRMDAAIRTLLPEPRAQKPQGRTVKVAAVQFVSELGAPERNRQALAAYVREAGRNGAKIVVLPETAITGYMSPDLRTTWQVGERKITDGLLGRAPAEAAETVPGPSTRAFCALAKELGIYLTIPFVEREESTGRYFNTTCLAGPDGRLLIHYRKLNPWPYAERGWATKGDRDIPTFDSEFGRMALLICFDINSEPPELKRKGVDLLLYSIAWVDAPASSWFEAELPRIARQNDIHIIGANWTVPELPDWHGYGHTLIIERTGRVAARVSRDVGEEIVYAELPVTDVAKKAPADDRRADAATVPAFEPYEMNVAVDPAARNPFDPDAVSVTAEFTHESGKVFTVPAFWSQDFTCEPVGEDVPERLTAKGEPGFRVRFSPPMQGTYRYRVIAANGPDRAEIAHGELFASKPRTGGPLRRGKSARYFENAVGEPVFLIGQNVGWSRRKAQLTDLLRYVDDLADSGQNFLRLWLCSWSLGFEHETMGRYDLARAWQMDQVVARAEQRGVHIMVCFENFHDITEKLSPYWVREGRPGGCIRNASEFFTSAEAGRAFQNRLRYALARWGPSRAIAAWEFFNEMEYVVLGPLELDSSVRDKYFRPWLETMQSHVKKWDAHGHLLANSLATDRVWDDMNRMDWLAVAQHHVYLNAWDSDDAGKVLRSLSLISDYGKPYMLGEFGGAEAGVYGATENVVNRRDKAGVHLHNAIWAGALSGSCATPLMWWWDEYVRPNKLYGHYAALEKFLRGTPWLDPKLRAEDRSTDAVRVCAICGDGWAIAWVQNRGHTWDAATSEPPVKAVSVRSLPIAEMAAGRYRIEWWDTYRGCVTRTEERKTEGGELSVEITDLATDLALKVIRIEPGAK